jgi:hypothetical protein
MKIKISDLVRHKVEVDFPATASGRHLSLRWKDGNFEIFVIKTGEVVYRYSTLFDAVRCSNQLFGIKDEVDDDMDLNMGNPFKSYCKKCNRHPLLTYKENEDGTCQSCRGAGK